MKKVILFFATIFGAASMVAQSGKSCSDPIPVDSNYVGSVSGAGTYWYTAWTYDLPLHVFFMPASDTSTVSPKVEVDFTCTPGVYDDPKLDSLLTMVEDFDVSVPMIFDCDLVVRDGKNAWDLSINKNYREQMAEFGITYNVQAFIKVTFFEGGDISLKPDTAFQSCMDNAQYLHLGDTINILPNDSDRVFVMPYTDWQNDSIRFVWIGEGTSKVYIAQQECDFVPNSFDPYVWDVYSITKDNPYKLYSEQMKDAIKQCVGGGLLYGKILAPTTGQLVVEKIPMAAAEGGAIVLEYGKSIKLPANDASALYCFPKTWGATQWLTNVYDSVQMYLSATSEFEASSDDANVYRVVNFDLNDGLQSMYYSSKEMKTLTNKATSDYVYVRFLAKKAAILTVDEWLISDCVDNSTILKPNVSKSISARANTNILRFRYSDFEGYALTIDWTGNNAVTCYIADTCSFVFLNDPHVLLSPEILRKSTYEIDSAIVASWASRVDADGFLYLCVYSERTGNVTFKTAKPIEKPEPPTPPVDPCLAVLPLPVPANKELTPALADSVYAIAVDELTKDSIRFTWNGVEAPLVIYMGNSCDVPADPNHASIISAITLQSAESADFATDYLKTNAANGKLYLRFVTTTTAQLVVDYILPKQEDVEELSLPLKLDSTINVLASNLAHTYYWNASWSNMSVEFVANTTDTVVAYMGTAVDFTLDENDPTYLGSYAFAQEDGRNSLQLSALQMSNLYAQATDGHIYMIFYADYATEVTPILWNACACVENSLELYPVDTKRIAAHSSSTVYRVKYSQWQDREVRLHWSGAETLWAYLADTCDFYLAANNEHVLNYNDVDILPNDTMVIGADVQMEAIDFGALPGHGFLYFRFHSPQAGVLTTTIIKDNQQGPTTGVEDTDVEDASRRIVCTPDGHIYILVGKDRYTILGEKL